MSLSDRSARRAGLCSAMMRKLSIDPLELARMAMGTVYYRISRTCILCRQADACAAWLASDASADDTGYRRFCPNSEKFDSTRLCIEACARRRGSRVVPRA
jgi:hypothetical protein